MNTITVALGCWLLNLVPHQERQTPRAMRAIITRTALRQRTEEWDTPSVLDALEQPEWKLQAACRPQPKNMFVPSSRLWDHAPALEICRRCPVRLQCFDYSIEIDDRFGVFGGTTASQRRRARQTPERLRRLRTQVADGTIPYQWRRSGGGKPGVTSIERLERVDAAYQMHLNGISHYAISRFFNIAQPTVRAWLVEARRRRVGDTIEGESA